MPQHYLTSKVRGEGRGCLTEVESKEFLQEMGINVILTKLVMSKEEATFTSREIGFPVAMKIISPDILHKSDAGGVRLGLRTSRQVGKAYDQIMSSVCQKHPQAVIHGVSIQKMAPPGVEVIIGMSKDAQFGPVLMFGLGGVLVELLRDVSFRIVPLTRRDAHEMIREIKGYPLLQGYRGQKPVDISSLEELLIRVSDLAEQNQEIKELDLNPTFAYENGAVVADARVVLEDL